MRTTSPQWCDVVRLCAACLVLAAGVSAAEGRAAEPATPRASRQAREILAYLRRLPNRPDHRTIIGQYCGANGVFERLSGEHEEMVVELGQKTGRRPGVLEYSLFNMFNGRFVGSAEAFVEFAFKRQQEGSLIYMSLRPPNPETGGGEAFKRSGDPIPADLSVVFTPGTAQYTRFRRALSQAGDVFKELERRTVVVLFEPFNELNGKWNWFANDTAEKFVRLWRYTFTYLTGDRGLTNLLWVWEWHSCRPVQWNRYPGDAHVDILGLSVYNSDPRDTYRTHIKALAGRGKPVAFTEFGPKVKWAPRTRKPKPPFFTWDNMVQLRAFKAHYPEAVFFIRWHSTWAIVNQSNARTFMADPWLIDLGRLSADRRSLRSETLP